MTVPMSARLAEVIRVVELALITREAREAQRAERPALGALPLVGDLRSPSRRRRASSATSIATRSAHGASSSDMSRSLSARALRVAARARCGARLSASRNGNAARLGRDRVERVAEPCRVDALVGRRRAHHGDVGRGRVEILRRLERFVEAIAEERDARGEDARRRIDRGEPDRGERGLLRERFVARVERDDAEPRRRARGLRRRRALLHLAFAVFGVVLVDRLGAPRPRSARTASPMRQVPALARSLRRPRAALARSARDRVPTRARRAPDLRGDRATSPERLRELHRLDGIAVDRRRSHETDLRDDEVGIELRRGLVAILRAAESRRARAWRPRGAGTTRRPCTSASDFERSAAAPTVSPWNKNDATCANDELLFADLQFARARETVLERDVRAAPQETGERALAEPVERDALGARVEVEHVRELLLHRRQKRRLALVHVRFDLVEDAFGLRCAPCRACS